MFYVLDPEVDSWPLMGSPYPIISIFLLYLYIVLKAGPKFMESRKPYNLITITRIYNIYQIAMCIHTLMKVPDSEFSIKYGWTCVNTPDPNKEISWDEISLRFWVVLCAVPDE